MYDGGKHNESGVEYLTLCTDIQKQNLTRNYGLVLFATYKNDYGKETIAS